VYTCEECGFVYDEERLRPLDQLLRAAGPRYRTILNADAGALRRRPAPETWSALEYACHVRDVLLMQRDRLYVALVEDTPSFKPMYREERVVLARYNEQDPAEVVEQIDVASELVAGAFSALDDAQLARRCQYGYPTPEVHTLRWVGVHTLHECEHHALDVARCLAAFDTWPDRTPPSGR
jgi:S-DNA-T family DNA segregation ATPase FtsK/SpoIIIE